MIEEERRGFFKIIVLIHIHGQDHRIRVIPLHQFTYDVKNTVKHNILKMLFQGGVIEFRNKPYSVLSIQRRKLYKEFDESWTS